MKNNNSKRVILSVLVIITISLTITVFSGCKKEKERGCDGDGICEPLYDENVDNCDDCKKQRGCNDDGICEPLYGENEDNCDDCL